MGNRDKIPDNVSITIILQDQTQINEFPSLTTFPLKRLSDMTDFTLADPRV